MVISGLGLLLGRYFLLSNPLIEKEIWRKSFPGIAGFSKRHSFWSEVIVKTVPPSPRVSGNCNIMPLLHVALLLNHSDKVVSEGVSRTRVIRAHIQFLAKGDGGFDFLDITIEKLPEADQVNDENVGCDCHNKFSRLFVDFFATGSVVTGNVYAILLGREVML